MPSVDLTDLFVRFGTALGLGLLVGMQREYAKRGEPDEAFAGARTFALIALWGALAAYAAPWAGEALLVASVGVLGLLLAVAYWAQVQDGTHGLTSEIAALVTLLAGALCGWDHLGLAAAVGVATAILLALKLPMRALAQHLTPDDVRATLTFAAITALVLPLLPRTPLGPPPFDSLTPYRLWLMVVLISGLSFLGYGLVKTVGAARGVGLAGLLGGLASSTAVTLSFTQHSHTNPALARPLAVGIVLAWTMMFGRVLVEVGVVHPALLPQVMLPVAGGAAVALACAGWLYWRGHAATASPAEHFVNPFSLGPALQFGLLYGAVLVISRAAQLYVGDAGVYTSALAAGLADVDALTLSMANLSLPANGLAPDVAARAIGLAVLSNTVVKSGMVLVLAAPPLRRALLPVALALVATLGVLSFV